MRFPRNLLCILAAGLSLPAQDLKELDKKVTEFSLPNGLHFIVLERHDAPVVSFHMRVNAGAIHDPAGMSGMSHLLGRIAFKGTETIGTRSWVEEKKALDAIEEVFDRMETEMNKGGKADQSRVDMLRTQARLAIDNARRSELPGEYLKAFHDNGAFEPVARTTSTATDYSFTLPSNRSELWFLMESQRLLHPAFREFYPERDAGAEEFRRPDPNSQIRLLGELLATAFHASPYRNPLTGWPGDLVKLRRGDAKAYFERYYVPGHITIAVCGDADPAEIKRMGERYFGPMPAKPLPPPVRGDEPTQNGPRTTVLESAGQPVLAVAYKRPSQYDRDDAVFDVIQQVVSQGRSGKLYAAAVEEKHVATATQTISTLPDGRGPNLFAFLLFPAPGHTVEENREVLEDVIQKLKTTAVDEQSLLRAKAQGRAIALRRLSNNPDMAAMLALHYTDFGDWHKLFANLDEFNKVTAEQVLRVANRYFVPTGRTTAYTVPPGQSDPTRPAAKPAAKGGQAQ